MPPRQKGMGLRKRKSTSPHASHSQRQPHRVHFTLPAEPLTPEISPEGLTSKLERRSSSPVSPESPSAARKRRLDERKSRALLHASSESFSKEQRAKFREGVNAVAKTNHTLPNDRTRSGRIAKTNIAPKPIPLDFTR